MAANEAGLKNKADMAEEMIVQMKEQLENLKKLAVSKAIKEEEERLTQENEALRKEILSAKEELCDAETRNGVKHVMMPSKNNKVMNGQPGEPVKKTIEEAKPAANENKQADKPGKQKAKKAGKPKAEQKPADDKPIDVSRLDMRIGHIVNCTLHPNAETLYVEEVDLGEGKNRTIVSGLVKHIPLEQMQDRLAIFMCNLKPAKMRGITSEGMIMCASSPEKCEIIVPPAGVVKGDRVSVDGFPGEPDELLNPKKKIWEQIQPDLKINEEGLATYKGGLWRFGDKGTCKAPSMTNSAIK